jgi:cytochrome c peroxidase
LCFFQNSNHENKTFSWLVLPLLFSCSNQDDTYVNLPLDSQCLQIPDLTYDISTNPPTEKGFELGKNYSMMVA